MELALDKPYCRSWRLDRTHIRASLAKEHVRDVVQYRNPISRSARPMILG